MTMNEVRMHCRVHQVLGAVTAVGLLLSGCATDPLDSLTGTPAAIRANYSNIVVGVGASVSLTASVVDGRNTPLTDEVTFAACDAGVTVTSDTAYHPVPAVSWRAAVNGATAGASCVNLAGGGQQLTVTVTITP